MITRKRLHFSQPAAASSQQAQPAARPDTVGWSFGPDWTLKHNDAMDDKTLKAAHASGLIADNLTVKPVMGVRGEVEGIRVGDKVLETNTIVDDATERVTIVAKSGNVALFVNGDGRSIRIVRDDGIQFRAKTATAASLLARLQGT